LGGQSARAARLEQNAMIALRPRNPRRRGHGFPVNAGWLRWPRRSVARRPHPSPETCVDGRLAAARTHWSGCWDRARSSPPSGTPLPPCWPVHLPRLLRWTPEDPRSSRRCRSPMPASNACRIAMPMINREPLRERVSVRVRSAGNGGWRRNWSARIPARYGRRQACESAPDTVRQRQSMR
jgi:hypothetical protein